MTMPAPLPLDVIETLVPFVDRESLERMRVVTGWPGRWYPVVLRTGATTLGSHVFFRKGHYRFDTARGLALIAHEAGHITQVRELGLPRFLLRYARGQFQCAFHHDRHPMEIPMIELQRRVREALVAAGWA